MQWGSRCYWGGIIALVSRIQCIPSGLNMPEMFPDRTTRNPMAKEAPALLLSTIYHAIPQDRHHHLLHHHRSRMSDINIPLCLAKWTPSSPVTFHILYAYNGSLRSQLLMPWNYSLPSGKDFGGRVQGPFIEIHSPTAYIPTQVVYNMTRPKYPHRRIILSLHITPYTPGCLPRRSQEISVMGKVWNKLSPLAVNKSDPLVYINGTECDQVSKTATPSNDWEGRCCEEEWGWLVVFRAFRAFRRG